MSTEIIAFIRELYATNDFIPLHAPVFYGNETKYVTQALQSTFVSSVGKFVDQFEQSIENYTDSPKAVATVNGTAALHTALCLSGVGQNDLVITQALTFVATCNAISYLGAEPLFIDVSKNSLGLSPQAVREYLEEFACLDDDGICFHKETNQKIKAVIPMHTFGHPVELDELQEVCNIWHLILIEDAAESLGSFYKGQHTGTIGDFGVLSFNGNKIITTGGGGMLLTNKLENGVKAKHLTTTAKVAHPYEFKHDELGFNYRLPSLNAALGCAQMEMLTEFIKLKRNIASEYEIFFNNSDYTFVKEPIYAKSNYWLNAVICPNYASRTQLIELTNEAGVMTRPVWTLMHKLPMYRDSLRGNLSVSEWLESHLVNIPSSVIKP
ncbi:MAG: degT/DnrJ/EryC1/StrS aminotransferase [Osedax symbiont Rs1]|nr:MAG: degT/DnrJ/EryC1/StrS aminotransferase [Osedax symbiont Rs1]